MSDNVIQRVFDLTEGIVKEEGCELIDVQVVFENGRKILRLFIDKQDGGVRLEDCARVSHSVEDLLEVEEVLRGRYFLEVSSPGMNRPLRLVEHFKRVLGQKIKVVTKEKIDGRKNYKGILKELKPGCLIIEIDNHDFNVPLKTVSKASLVSE